MTPALPALKHVPSPNCSLRGGAAVRLFVVHDCEGSYAGSIGWFAQVRSQVSAHLVLRRDGLEATQCVPMDRKAWHACAANPYSDSLELEGFEKDGFSDAELDAAAAPVRGCSLSTTPRANADCRSRLEGLSPLRLALRRGDSSPPFRSSKPR